MTNQSKPDQMSEARALVEREMYSSLIRTFEVLDGTGKFILSMNAGDVVDMLYLTDLRARKNADALTAALDEIERLRDTLATLSHIHDGNPSDAYADTPPLDYARHMLFEARQLAREALNGTDQ